MNISTLCSVDFGSTIRCSECGAWLDIIWNTPYSREVEGNHIVKCPNCEKQNILVLQFKYSTFKVSDIHEINSKFIIASRIKFTDYPNYKIFQDPESALLVVGCNNGWTNRLSDAQYDNIPKIFDTLEEAQKFNKSDDEFIYEVKLDENYIVTKWIKSYFEFK